MKVNGKVKNLIKRPSTLFFIDAVYKMIEDCDDVNDNKDLKSFFENQWITCLRAILPIVTLFSIFIGFIISFSNKDVYYYFAEAPMFKFSTISIILTYHIRLSFKSYKKFKRKFYLNTCLKYFLNNYSHNEFLEYFDKNIENNL